MLQEQRVEVGAHNQMDRHHGFIEGRLALEVAALPTELQDILQQGRQSGDFERKTPLDETVMATYLVMRPYLNPVLLQHGFDYTDEAPAQLSSLVLRSLSP